MANKRFVKPEPIPQPPAPAPIDWAARYASENKLAQNEYRYCMTQAKRLHPEWTLKQRQEYARLSVSSLFDGDYE